MRVALAFVMLLLVGGAVAAEPVYIDQLMETPLATLQQSFPGLKREGCYQLAPDRYLMISMNKKEGKPWRVALAAAGTCRKAEDVAVDVRHRGGVELGATTISVVEKLGRPDASAAPDTKLKQLGDIEYFYICRLSEGCARHTSVFIRDGRVTAISEWYSE